YLGEEEFRPGDVFIGNDPYHGGGHLPDYNVYAPVYADGRLILIPSIQCHHGDTGGAVPGGYNVTANDIWGEGVRWPVMKVIDRGKERRDVLYSLATNNRPAPPRDHHPRATPPEPPRPQRSPRPTRPTPPRPPQPHPRPNPPPRAPPPHHPTPPPPPPPPAQETPHNHTTPNIPNYLNM